MKFQGDILNFYDFIQVFVFTTNHHLKSFFCNLTLQDGRHLPLLKKNNNKKHRTRELSTISQKPLNEF